MLPLLILYLHLAIILVFINQSMTIAINTWHLYLKKGWVSTVLLPCNYGYCSCISTLQHYCFPSVLKLLFEFFGTLKFNIWKQVLKNLPILGFIFSLHSQYYAEACNELAGPISVSLRLKKMQLHLKQCGGGGEPLATLCPIWPTRGLNLRPPAPNAFYYRSTKWLVKILIQN